jgi:[ribosomal protein S5]-alanine N-acetyltransferase
MQLHGGKLLLLRDFEASDGNAFMAIHSDPRMLRYYAPGLWTTEHGRMLVQSFIRWANEAPRENYQLAIVHVETDELLGSCGVRKKGYPKGQAEFGIGIAPKWWGKGIAQEAARAILGFGFGELNLREIHGESVSVNRDAAKLVQRLGFTSSGSRPAESWMADRGWSAVDWVLTHDTWKRLAETGR